MAAVRAVSLHSILALTLVIAVRPAPLAGQPAAPPSPGGRATFALIGSMKLDDYTFTTVGLELLNIERGGPGTRIAITTVPRVIREGIFLLDVELGPAYVARVSDGAALVPYGGIDFDFVPNGALWGAHAGMGLLVRLSPRTGLRLMVARRWFRVEQGWEPATTWSVGVGALPR